MALPVRRVAAVAGGLLALLALVAAIRAPVAPVSLTVPFSATPFADADLDGDPATGTWADAISAAIPLENGAPDPYGTATLFAKHDGTYAYFRVDGASDVPWTGPSGEHFWFGVLFAPASVTGHHRSGQDGVFFGDSAYTSAEPLLAVDTDGGRPPLVDASQDTLGTMRVTGSAAPYAFTAEWKRKLVTGDAADVGIVADNTTAYALYASTDSDGGGSNGGTVAHNAVTNDNVVRFETARPWELPTSAIGIAHDPPEGVAPGVQIYVSATLTNATRATVLWRNSTMAADERVPMTNLSRADGTGWVYAAWLPAQPTPTQIRYGIDASGPQGSRVESFFLTVAGSSPSGITPEENGAWLLTVASSLAMSVSVMAVLYWYVGRRLRREGR